jgi:uncharacterized protein
MAKKLAHPGFWMAALLTLMAVIVQTALSVPLTAVDEVLKRSFHKPALRLLDAPSVVGLVNIAAFGVAIAVGLNLNRLPLRRAFPLGWPTIPQLLGMLLTILGADILLSEVDNLFRTLATPPEWLLEAYGKILSPEGNLVGRLFLLVLVAPVTEELLFRGVILRGLLSRFPSWLAIGFAALFFAVGHVNPWQFASAFWIGAVFGWFYLRTGSVMPCILGHAVSNGLFVLVTSLPLEVPGLTSGPDSVEVSFQPWWLDVSGVVLLLAGIYGFIRATPCLTCGASDEPPVIPPPTIGISHEDTAPPVIPPPPLTS